MQYLFILFFSGDMNSSEKIENDEGRERRTSYTGWQELKTTPPFQRVLGKILQCAQPTYTANPALGIYP